MASRRQGALIYTAQDVARFCEVDLKTVHHWADKGKVPCSRTEGRHLRFRRNDVVRFLRAHGYPLPDGLSRARPSVALAVGEADLVKKLGARFAATRFASGLVAVAHLLSDQPDALVIALDDPTLAGVRSIAAIKHAPETAWILVAAIAPDDALASARDAGAEIALPAREIGKVVTELTRALAV
jgi:excisionase family DNA binding protein